jgi:hypothetical protein
MAQNPPSEYVPRGQAQPHPAPVPPQPVFLPPPVQAAPPAVPEPPAPLAAQPPARLNGQTPPPQFPGGGAEAPYRAYVPASRKGNWTLAIIWTVGLLLAIPALFLFIGIFAWASGMYR